MEFHGLTLDSFQERAVQSIEKGHSVLIGAPTGSGKTLVAEYAVERSLSNGQRVIYTAPIKALSNQKFHDFHARFGDRVGILTGDVSINSGADVVVMTTEVLRNTILEDAERLHDVAYVVFDEIHYVNDIERGTVWEESLILCPQHIAFVCLSATAPNLDEFADWIRSIHSIPVDVIIETKRSVPIEIAFHADPIGLCDFKTVKRAATLLRARHGHWGVFAKEWERQKGGVPIPITRIAHLIGGGKRRSRRSGPSHVTLELLDYLAKNDRLPCLFFSQMRRLCEVRAECLAHHYTLQPDESKSILERFDSLCDLCGLQDEASAMRLRELVKVGVAYHHAGMLPALKQVIERLFATGRIRALFATETFAVGVNMPARSVVFDGLEKFDGVSVRPLMAREFQQMSGRAGRRGIDKRGYVFAQVDLRQFVPQAAEHAIYGTAEAIDSQFDLSYSSILNLYDQYGDGMYDICRKSYAHFQAAKRMSHVDERMAKENSRLALSYKCPHGVFHLRESYHSLKRRLQRARRDASWTKRALRKAGKNPPDHIVCQEQVARIHFEELKAERDAMQCQGCEKARECARVARAVRKKKKAVGRLRGIRGKLSERYENDVKRRFGFLRTLGYVNDEGLTPKGRVASHIFGYELQVTELLFEGYFEKLSEVHMNVLAAAIVVESKKSTWYRKSRTPMPLLIKAQRSVNSLVAKERKMGLRTGARDLDMSLTSAVLAWSKGAQFQDLAKHTNSADGDLVRSLRLILDLYRQIKHAMPEHKELTEKINRAVSLIMRPPVDPEWELVHTEEGPEQ